MSQLKQKHIEKAVFVTEENRKALAQMFKLNNYKESCVLGNALSSKRELKLEELTVSEKAEQYKLCTLLRITKDRKNDVDRMLDFAKYIKDNSIENVHIDVYGDGDYYETMTEQIDKLEVFDILTPCGRKNDIKEVYKEHDAAIDFSDSQSFGMVYIEAILNGRMVFCRHNIGSDEVLRNLPQCFFNTNDELYQNIQNLRYYTYSEMKNNYEVIAERFSREQVTKRFIEFLKLKAYDNLEPSTMC